MHWRILKNETPCSGDLCVVGRIVNRKTRSSVFTFMYGGKESKWLPKSGPPVQCLDIDHWCPVSEIIQSVENKVVESIESEFGKI